MSWWNKLIALVCWSVLCGLGGFALKPTKVDLLPIHLCHQEVRACKDIELPKVDREKAIQEATKLHAPARLVPGGNFVQAALVTSKKWPNGKTLRVKFLPNPLPSDRNLEDRILAAAQEWSKYANLKFVRSNDDNSEIRISLFLGNGSWSTVGTDALGVPLGQATMNYGWLVPSSDHATLTSVVLHEFGHAIGLIHEHQSPGATIPWDVQAVYKYYSGPPNNWSKATIDFNIFNKYAANLTNYTAWDPTSIMQYSIDPALTGGKVSVGWNTTLSEIDKRFIASAYPGVWNPPPPDPRIETNRQVIANLREVFSRPPVYPVLYLSVADLSDVNGDGFADFTGLIGIQVSKTKRQLWKVVWDGVSTTGGTIGVPVVVMTF